MMRRSTWTIVALAAMLAGCASLPTPVMPADEYDPESYTIPDPAPMAELIPPDPIDPTPKDRKSTRLNSSHP